MGAGEAVWASGGYVDANRRVGQERNDVVGKKIRHGRGGRGRESSSSGLAVGEGDEMWDKGVQHAAQTGKQAAGVGASP